MADLDVELGNNRAAVNPESLFTLLHCGAEGGGRWLTTAGAENP